MKPQHLLLLACAMFVAGCDGGATVTIRNSSPAELRNLVLVGSCFRAAVPDQIAPGASRAFLVAPRCESGLGLEFDAAGERYVVPPSGYFEGSANYVVMAEVGPNFAVQVETELAFAVDTSRE